MLIDVHVHFHHDRTPSPDWEARNRRRLEVGERIGVTWHVASILGTWGRYSPTYMPSPEDVTYGNERMYEIAARHADRVRAYVMVNPNFTRHAVTEIERGAEAGAVGLKLAASRRANDRVLDPVIEAAAAHGFPVLHHVWQHRRRDWPGQEASDGAELCELASRHPSVSFILAHLGGGGDWRHTVEVVRDVPNVYLDLSGSGVDAGMLESALECAGDDRCVWGTDITQDTGWAKLRYLERIGLRADTLEKVRWRNAEGIFPRGAFRAA